MELIRATYKNTGTIHHGYCIAGDRNEIFNNLCVFFEEDFNFPIKSNADFWVEEFDAFGIDDSRRVKEVHATKSFRTDSRKVYVIKANSITREAQNALLKIFEEPSPGNHFFIITPSTETLLPTLRSRLQVIEFHTTSLDENVKKAEAFIHASPGERLEIVKKLVEEIANEEKTKSDAVAFVSHIERVIHDKKEITKLSPYDVHVFSEIIKCRGYLTDRSSSVKMILEHLSLTI